MRDQETTPSPLGDRALVRDESEDSVSEHKTLTGVEVKDASKGTVEAVFATLDVIDKDGDVTVKGAFEDGAPVRISAYGHGSWGSALPVGKGTIHERGSEAILEGQFFLDTSHGRDHFETVKEMGELMEWSYGFDVVKSGRPPEDAEPEWRRTLEKLKVHEVSPVLLGAGVNTRTLAVKTRASFPDEAERVLGDVQELVSRVQGWGSDSDRKVGRVLSAANRERLATLEASLDETLAEIRSLLAETDPDKGRDLLVREFMRFERMRAAL